VSRALTWLDAVKGRSRFLFVHLYDPHGPYRPDPAVAERFYRETGRPPLAPEQILSYQRHGESFDPDDYVARYDGEIFGADREVGRLLAALPRDAIVAFTADHGEGLGEGGYWFRHGALLNDACLHVPLVFLGPGVPKALTVDEVVANLDVAPTLLDLAGLPPLPGARGRSLRGWTRPRATETRPVFSEARRRPGVSDQTGVDTRYKVAVSTSRHRALLWPGTGESILIDPRADPDEANDLSARFPDDAARLTAALRRFLLLGDRLLGDAPREDVDHALKGLGYFRNGGDPR
jgi:arylsulfatase A-like enzyme